MSAAHDAAEPVLPEVGQVLDGRFELLGVLGEGGMGHVFRARDRRLGREVALKLLTPRYLGRPERELRFLQELELGQRAEHHRSLAEYVESGRLRELQWPYVVMELVRGKDLASRLTRGPLPPPEAARLARQVAGAVLALHRAGIVHRDVTTMNVLVADGDAVLIDLSHACEVAAPQGSPGERQRLTRENEVPGTDHFMPPEQARAEPAQPAMDVYAFGVMLVHMLTGVMPGQCGREAFIELQREGRLRPPRIDTRVYTEVPLALAELVDACVAVEPGRRPSMDEVVRRLDEQLVVMTASLEPDGVVVAANEAGDSAATGVASREAVEQAERVRVSRRLVLVAACVVVLGALAWGWSRGMDGESVEEDGGPGDPGSEMPAVVVSEHDAVESPTPTAPEAPPERPGSSNPESPEPEAPSSTPEKTHEPTSVKPERTQPTERRQRARRAPPKPVPEIPAVDPCEGTADRAAAARKGRRWSEIVQLTAKPRCWDDPVARVRLRIKALSELGRYGDCVKLGETSTDAETKRLATHCGRRLEEAP